MKALFDNISRDASRNVTKTYSSSFFAGIKRLDSSIQGDIHAIYGFVRFADEIVDSFHDFEKEELLSEFKEQTFHAISRGISLNPILNSFQACVRKYDIDQTLIEQFFHSMEMDLNPISYNEETYREYIFGSAESVGLMCLTVFVNGDRSLFEQLKPSAMKLGSAFQKINFLRDLKDDIDLLGRVYFPQIGRDGRITAEVKLAIEAEIAAEFAEAYKGILLLPKSCRFGVYLSYVYYTRLLRKIRRKTVQELMDRRVSIPPNAKAVLFWRSYLRHSLNVL